MIQQIFLKMRSKKDLIFYILAIILIVAFTKSITPKKLQNDTFYTIKIGELISGNGIDGEDHFSWHDGLPYTYPHWLYDLGMYNIFKNGGWSAIYISTCIFSALLGICIFFTNSKISNNKVLSFFITIGVMYLIKSYIAARAQLVTFILFILQIYNIEMILSYKKDEHSKKAFLMPKLLINATFLILIHILIANLHVAVWPFSFVLYLPYIAEYIIACFIDFVIYRKLRTIFYRLRIRNINKKIRKYEINTEKGIDKNIGNSNLVNEEVQQNIINLKQKIEVIKANLRSIEDRNLKINEKRKNEIPFKIVLTKNKNTKKIILIMFIAVLTGFMTPLGKTPFTYTYLTIIGNTVKNINEHLPLTLIKNTPIICTLIIVIGFLSFTKSKIKLSDLFMLGGLLYLMFSSRRQQSMFVLIGSVAFTRTVTNWMTTTLNYPPEKIIKKWINPFTIFVVTTLTLLLSVNLYKNVKNEVTISRKTYPVDACEWILKNIDVKKAKFFNEYNYGSYMIYKGIPVFVDSRADLYAPEFNTNTGDKEDGKDIFMDFINTSSIASYYGNTFKKYGITHIILYKNSKISMLIKNADAEKYEELYSDDNFVIYKVK